jgi:hypothetical protein
VRDRLLFADLTETMLQRFAVANAGEGWRFGGKTCGKRLCLCNEAVRKLRSGSISDRGAVGCAIRLVKEDVRVWATPRLLFGGGGVSSKLCDLERTQQSPWARGRNGICRSGVQPAELHLNMLATLFREFKLKTRSNLWVVWSCPSGQEAAQQSTVIKTGPANHDGDLWRTARCRCTNRLASDREPVVEGEGLISLGNVDPCVGSTRTHLRCELICADVKATEDLS